MTDTGKFYTNYSFEYPNENVRVATSSFQDVSSNKKTTHQFNHEWDSSSIGEITCNQNEI